MPILIEQPMPMACDNCFAYRKTNRSCQLLTKKKPYGAIKDPDCPLIEVSEEETIKLMAIVLQSNHQPTV